MSVASLLMRLPSREIALEKLLSDDRVLRMSLLAVSRDLGCLLINSRISFPISRFFMIRSSPQNTKCHSKKAAFRSVRKDPVGISLFCSSSISPSFHISEDRRKGESPRTQCGTDWLARLSVVRRLSWKRCLEKKSSRSNVEVSKEKEEEIEEEYKRT